MKKRKKEHTAPWECTYAKEEESQCMPGKPPKSDKEYFEILCLCILQAGLAWGMVRRNWAIYKEGFYGFEVEKLANVKIDDLMCKPGVIKNRRKVKAVINNAKTFQKIIDDYGSFKNYLDYLNSDGNDEIIDEMVKMFAHLGEYSAEYFLHSVGYRQPD